MNVSQRITAFDKKIYANYRIIHGIRIALAFVLTFVILRFLYIPESTWPLITLVVVMGPMSFLGNVRLRAVQRILGTCIGAISGLIALYLEIYSLVAMLIWCAFMMFICGYLALGKRPYAGLLIGITLGIVVGAHPGDIHTALWRSGDVILGSILALIFTSIYPQRAYTRWRLHMSDVLKNMGLIYRVSSSVNILNRPDLDGKHQQAINEIVKIRTLIAPSVREIHGDKKVFEAIQTITRNVLTTLSLMTDAYWASRESHFIMINAGKLKKISGCYIRCFRCIGRVINYRK